MDQNPTDRKTYKDVLEGFVISISFPFSELDEKELIFIEMNHQVPKVPGGGGGYIKISKKTSYYGRILNEQLAAFGVVIPVLAMLISAWSRIHTPPSLVCLFYTQHWPSITILDISAKGLLWHPWEAETIILCFLVKCGNSGLLYIWYIIYNIHYTHIHLYIYVYVNLWKPAQRHSQFARGHLGQDT